MNGELQERVLENFQYSEGKCSSIELRCKTLFQIVFQVKVPFERNVTQLTMDKLNALS